MELHLHFLDSFTAQGSDGATYRVKAYERMAPDAPATHGFGDWQSTGIVEHHLEDGRLVDVKDDGTMRIVNSGVELRRVDAAAAGKAQPAGAKPKQRATTH